MVGIIESVTRLTSLEEGNTNSHCHLVNSKIQYAHEFMIFISFKPMDCSFWTRVNHET